MVKKYWLIFLSFRREISNEEKEKLIEKVAKKIHNSGFNIAAIFLLEIVKPLSYVGSMMSRMFLSPFLPFLGNDIEDSGDKIMYVFEKTENVDKVIKLLEQYEKESKND
jgi:hypothetical protein